MICTKRTPTETEPAHMLTLETSSNSELQVHHRIPLSSWPPLPPPSPVKWTRWKLDSTMEKPWKQSLLTCTQKPKISDSMETVIALNGQCRLKRKDSTWIKSFLKSWLTFPKLQKFSLKSEPLRKNKQMLDPKSWSIVTSLAFRQNWTPWSKYITNTSSQGASSTAIRTRATWKESESSSQNSRLLSTKSLRPKKDLMPGKPKESRASPLPKKSETTCGRLASEWTEYRDSCPETKPGHNGTSSSFFDYVYTYSAWQL